MTFPRSVYRRWKGKRHLWITYTDENGKQIKEKELRIHDLRHFATTMLFIEGVADTIIRKITGHRSEELERYKYLSPQFLQQMTKLIAGKIEGELGTKLSHLHQNENGSSEEKP